ncbi:hypothetical protein BDR05DRAFT_1004969 [Suillus weaverae]|nr:hypothetical protein BDR05DRAFT_1004969 [Suillus weaverae]
MSDYEQPSSQPDLQHKENPQIVFLPPSTLKKHKVSKAKAVLVIQQVLAEATTEGDPSSDSGFAHYFEVLDAIRTEEEPEKWSDDPKYYHTKITTTPRCLKLSTSQWTSLLEGKAIDLDKVFTRCYSTAIDSKQTQSLGKGFELSLSQPTISHKVKSMGDWGITTDLWTQALTFIMPWCEEEVRDY